MNLKSSSSSVNMITQNNMENMKVSSLLFKQVKDPYAISSSSLPNWCTELIHSFTYLSSFNSRYLLFKVSSFDRKRSMINLYIYLKNFLGENIFEDKTLGTSLKRHKFKIDRESIIKDTEKLMNEFSNYNGSLEFEYLNETGTGLGPTLEFYSLIANEIKHIQGIWYKTSDYSLFPAPCNPYNNNLIEETKRIFTLLGFVIARGLYDDRLLDFPINSLFWDILLERPTNINSILKIDKDLGNAFNDFQKIIQQKKSFNLNQKYLDNDINDIIKYNNTKIEDIGLTFILPGYNDIELKRGGSDILVTIRNLEEYVSLVFDKLLLSGIKPFAEAFKNGFNKVFPIDNLKCFTSSELEEVICGCSQENWDYDLLSENIIPNHGYDKNSYIFKGLLEIMVEMNSFERKFFLMFVTGCPRLPLGGINILNN
jgi:E3 ubiquitin-protein ligase TRIP12